MYGKLKQKTKNLADWDNNVFCNKVLNYSKHQTKKGKTDFQEHYLLFENFNSIIKIFNNLILFSSYQINPIFQVFLLLIFSFLMEKKNYLEAKFFIFSFFLNSLSYSKFFFLYKVFLITSNKLKKGIIFKIFKKKTKFFLESLKIFENFSFNIDNKSLPNIYGEFKKIIFCYRNFYPKLRKKKNPEIKCISENLRKMFLYSQKYNTLKNLEKKCLNKKYENNLSNPCNPCFLKIIKVQTKKSTLINCLDISLNQKILTIGDQTSSVNVINLFKKNSKKRLMVLRGHSSSISCVRDLNLENFIISASIKGELFLWKSCPKTLVMKYQLPNLSIWDISFYKKNKNFLTAGSSGFAAYWNIERSFPLRFFKGHARDINIIKLHPNENFLATGSDDRSVCLWDIRIKKQIGKIFIEGPVHSFDFSLNGDNIVICGKSQFINMIDLRTLKNSFKIKETNVKCKIDKIVYINQDEFAYVKDWNIVKLWNNFQKKNEKFNSSIYSKEFFPTKVNLPMKNIFQLKKSRADKLIVIGLNI